MTNNYISGDFVIFEFDKIKERYFNIGFIVVCIIIILAFLASFYLGSNLIKKHMPWVRTISQIKYELVQVKLHMKTLNSQTIKASLLQLKKAQAYNITILKASSEYKEITKLLRENHTLFENLIKEVGQYNQKNNYALTYKKLEMNLDKSEVIINRFVAQETNQILLLQLLLIVVIITVLIFTAYVSRGYYKRYIRTIRKLNLANQDLQIASRTDFLTGLHNKRSFEESMPELLTKAYKNHNGFALIIIDIDNFQLFCEMYGHKQGNEVLQRLAVVIAEEIEDEHQMAFRLSIEEFAIIDYATAPESIFSFAERIRKKAHALKIFHEHSPIDNYITVSCGIAHTSYTDIATSEVLYTLADGARFKSKTTGKNKSTLLEYVDDEE